MKRLLASLCLALAAPAFAVDLHKVHVLLDGVVNRAKGDDATAVEVRKGRRIYLADIDGDGIADAIAFFTIEGMAGGNNYESYVAVLKGSRAGFSLLDTALIGGGGLGAPLLTRPIVKDGRIVISRMEYLDTDARCCPSRKTEVALRLQESKLFVLPKAR